MAKRKAKEIFPTMKIEAKKDSDDVAFQAVTAKIVSVTDLETKYGDKVVMTLSTEKLGSFNVFVNNVSMERLIKAYGDDDDTWKDKTVVLEKQTDDKFDKDMIVILPKA